MKPILAMIMAGGQGHRLMPLTRDRAKPAVPFGGIYRVVDFTLSNCLNSELKNIVVLAQYKSISLDRHIRLAWSRFFREEMGEWLQVLHPQQRTGSGWYLGTADSIHQNIYTLQQTRPDVVLILSGDHIYKMDYRPLVSRHLDMRADLTVACLRLPQERACELGVVECDDEGRVVRFHEKPVHAPRLPAHPGECMASMGVYVFETEALVREVVKDGRSDSEHDFGGNIIPSMIGSGRRVFAFEFCEEDGKPGYWRDIGRTDTYYEANMDLVRPGPGLVLDDSSWPIWTYHEQIPPAKVTRGPGGREGEVVDSILSAGCVVAGGKVERSVLSPGVRVGEGALVQDSVLFGDVAVGKGAVVRKAIVDKQVCIPPGWVSRTDAKGFTVTEGGVMVIQKGMPLG